MSDYDLVIDKITDQIEILAEPVVSGSCIDFDEYILLTGKIQGLREAIKILQEMKIKRIKEEDG